MVPSGEIPGCLSLKEAVKLAEALTHYPYDNYYVWSGAQDNA